MSDLGTNAGDAAQGASQTEGQGASSTTGTTGTGQEKGSQPAPEASTDQAAKAQAVITSASTLALEASEIVSIVGTIAGAAFPGAQVAGFTVAQLSSLAVAVANAVPEAVQAFEEIKAVAESGQAPTPEQWSAWNAAADQAHADLQAAAAT